MYYIRHILYIFLVCFSLKTFAVDSIKTKILIVGAGPSGLTLANILDHIGEDYIITDKNNNPSYLSKATGIHRNSMRLLKQIGIADDVIEKSILLNGGYNFKDFVLVNQMIFTQGEEYFDKNISINQGTLEDILTRHMSKKIMFGNSIKSYSMKDGKIFSVINDGNSQKIVQSEYLVGADGANSVVRSLMKVKYDGVTTKEKAFVFDAKVKDPVSKSHMYLFDTNSKRVVLVPIPGENQYKFAGRISGDDCSEQNLKNVIFERSKIEIDSDSIEGLSFYRTKCHLAEKFSNGNVVLIGDSAHTFFPAGGYGLNFAIEDSFALAWRLARGDDLEKSYNIERKEIASIFQDDAKAKKYDSENMNYKKSKDLERNVYNKNSDLLEFRRVGDELYNFIYKNIDNQKEFLDYTFKMVYCHDIDLDNKKIIDSVRQYNIKSFFKIKSDKCIPSAVYVIRPDLFYQELKL